jgi:hypothetical protein
METRTCRVCKETFPLTEKFYQANGWNRDKTLQYFRPECKNCRSEDTKGRNKARKLVGNPETPKLGSPCELCGRQDQRLVFDHCKANLKHRGWLCNSCNKGIGLLGDTVESLEKVVLYLKSKS